MASVPETEANRPSIWRAIDAGSSIEKGVPSPAEHDMGKCRTEYSHSSVWIHARVTEMSTHCVSFSPAPPSMAPRLLWKAASLSRSKCGSPPPPPPTGLLSAKGGRGGDSGEDGGDC